MSTRPSRRNLPPSSAGRWRSLRCCCTYLPNYTASHLTMWFCIALIMSVEFRCPMTFGKSEPHYNTLLALVNTCHVVGTVHLYKYWPLTCFPATVGRSDTSQRNYRRFVCTTWQADKWLVGMDTVSLGETLWDCDDGDQVIICQMYLFTILCQRKRQYWR